MDSAKVKKFMDLGGQRATQKLDIADLSRRKLGAQLLLSEVLEYVIRGLGIVPEVSGTQICDANSLRYNAADYEPDPIEMIDGLADTAYTMYWNALAFGIPLERAFDMVCDNNLEKFVALNGWTKAAGELPRDEWHCGSSITWPPEVVQVEVLKVGAEFFAVGKDQHGKVRKHSSYRQIELTVLL